VTEPTRTEEQTPAQLPGDIEQLLAAVDELPAEHRAKMTPIIAQVIQSTKRRRRILHLVQEAIGQLRLDMKYLVFDLEATRRERDDFRCRLEESGE